MAMPCQATPLARTIAFTKADCLQGRVGNVRWTGVTSIRALNLRVNPPTEAARSATSNQVAPYLRYRRRNGGEESVILSEDREALTIGRRTGNDIALPWDPIVSRVHARLERVGEAWTFSDEGLSRNGSYLNGQRVTGRRRLHDGDTIRLGNTVLTYRDPAEQSDTTLVEIPLAPPTLSDIQRRVLLALARPCCEPGNLHTPASNSQIAQELSYSVAAVKGHLRVLFSKFAVPPLPQNQKRLKLVELALLTGAISPRDL
jgi:pSer/pThr/pTyr-binding forkhead associated (FHA) protein